ncbi:hypothetical protein [Rhodococcus rhodnii]|uniref:Uncharacterized protein n=1 Tax=Rhodococcus rhodnii LMG 5362 TaxID=1273125 RepID=R7WPS3_9NOCA|nr:hypothetical protein [Rhodococcus rhodnii]EOM77280.1 hypothetical protein Rrhod_1342 [Rhodococcus rhodnii LMG 5362]
MKTQEQLEARLRVAQDALAAATTDEDRAVWRDAVETWESVIELRREKGLWEEGR